MISFSTMRQELLPEINEKKKKSKKMGRALQTRQVQWNEPYVLLFDTTQTSKNKTNQKKLQ